MRGSNTITRASKKIIVQVLCFLFLLFTLTLSSPYASALNVSTSIVEDVCCKTDQVAEDSIATDSNNRPHIVYYDPGENTIKHATRDCLTCNWQIEIITKSIVDKGAGQHKHYLSFALDSKNVPHITYVDHNEQWLNYATKNGVWTIDKKIDLSGASHTFRYTGIKIDSNGIPHIVYAINGANGVYIEHSKRVLSNYWVGENIYFNPGHSLRGFSFSLDSKNDPHVIFEDYTNSKFKYVMKMPLENNFAVSNNGITASGNEPGNEPYKVNDNDINTRWANNGVGSWIRLDLGSIKNVCSVGIAWYKGYERYYNFVISTSTDGNTFIPIPSTSSGGTTLASERYMIPPYAANARYVKVTVNGNSDPNSGTWASITELDVFGSSTACPTWKAIDMTVPIGTMVNPYLVLDPLDGYVPHLSYTNANPNFPSTNLYHARNPLIAFQREEVASFFTGIVRYSKIAMDEPGDNAHFIDIGRGLCSNADPCTYSPPGTTGGLGYTKTRPFLVGGTQEIVALEGYNPTTKGPASFPDMAIDHNGDAQLSYVMDNMKIKYALIKH
jgi:hypothetical protein